MENKFRCRLNKSDREERNGVWRGKIDTFGKNRALKNFEVGRFMGRDIVGLKDAIWVIEKIGTILKLGRLR